MRSEKKFRHRFSHTAHIHSMYCLSLYTFWLWWSRVASMYNKLFMFPIIAMSTTFWGAFQSCP
ncbi:hypothetical protein V8E52_008485 [Russula decolorans]